MMRPNLIVRILARLVQPMFREAMRQDHRPDRVAEETEKRVAQALERSRLRSLEIARTASLLSVLHLRSRGEEQK